MSTETRLIKAIDTMTLEIDRKPTPATCIAQALRFAEESKGAVIPSIQSAATYAWNQNCPIRKPYWHRRDGSQTTEQAKAIIAELEGATESLLLSSGMSACTAVIEQLPAGAHVVMPKVMCHGVLHQFQMCEAKKRVSLNSYTAGNLDEMRTAVRDRETKRVWVETPSNPN